MKAAIKNLIKDRMDEILKELDKAKHRTPVGLEENEVLELNEDLEDMRRLMNMLD